MQYLCAKVGGKNFVHKSIYVYMTHDVGLVTDLAVCWRHATLSPTLAHSDLSHTYTYISLPLVQPAGLNMLLIIPVILPIVSTCGAKLRRRRRIVVYPAVTSKDR